METEDVNSAVLSIYKAFFTGVDAQTLLSLAREYLGNPIIISNANLDVPASSGELDILDSHWRRIINKGSDGYLLFQELTEYGIVDRILNSKEPFLLTHPTMEHRWIVGQLQSRKVHLGVILVIEYDKKFEQADFELVKALCELFSYSIANHNLLIDPRHPKYEFLLAELFNGNYCNPQIIHNSLDHLDWNQNLIHHVMVAKGDSKFKPTILTLVKDLLEKADQRIKGVVFENQVSLLISLEEKKYQRLFNPVIEGIFPILESHHLLAGISRAFSDISAVREYYLETTEMLELAKRQGRTDCMIYFDDLALDLMLDIVSKNSDLSRFYGHNLLSILAYDHTYSTHYLRDTYAIIMSGNDKTKAAERLNIHPNTVAYRIRKIEELFKIDLSDPETVFKLNTSLRILRFAEGDYFYQQYKIPRPG